MLPKENLLKSDSDFKKVFRYGKISENEFIKIKFLKNNKKNSRFGFIISNKFAKQAVMRNLIKRRLRASTRFLLKNINSGFDIVVWPKIILKSSNYQVLLFNFKQLLIKNDISSV